MDAMAQVTNISPLIVDTVDAPALPPLHEFKVKWPRFLLSPPPTPMLALPPTKIQHRRRLTKRQLAMPPALPPPRSIKSIHNADAYTAYCASSVESLSSTDNVFIISTPDHAPSLSDPSTSSPSSVEENDYHSSATTLWDTYYTLPPTARTSTNDLFPLPNNQSPFEDAAETATIAPPIPPRSASRTSNYTSTKSLRPATPRCQIAPPLHFCPPRRPPPPPIEAFRHFATPPLPPPSPPPRSVYRAPLASPSPRSLSPSTKNPPTLSLFPSVPRTRARRPLTEPCVQPMVLAEKSIWEEEEEEELKAGLKGMRAMFHVRGASRAQGRRRKSAGDVVRGIFGGLCDRRDKGGKGT